MGCNEAKKQGFFSRIGTFQSPLNRGMGCNLGNPLLSLSTRLVSIPSESGHGLQQINKATLLENKRRFQSPLNRGMGCNPLCGGT